MTVSRWVEAVMDEYGSDDPHTELARAMAAGGNLWQELPNAKRLADDLVKAKLLEPRISSSKRDSPVPELAKPQEVWTMQLVIPERFLA